MVEFKDRLRILREESGLTQKELAKKLVMSHVTISDYETGKKSDPYMSTLRKLAKFFDVTLDYLVGDTGTRERRSAERLSDIVNTLDENRRRELAKYAIYLRGGGKDNERLGNL